MFCFLEQSFIYKISSKFHDKWILMNSEPNLTTMSCDITITGEMALSKWLEWDRKRALIYHDLMPWYSAVMIPFQHKICTWLQNDIPVKLTQF